MRRPRLPPRIRLWTALPVWARLRGLGGKVYEVPVSPDRSVWCVHPTRITALLEPYNGPAESPMDPGFAREVPITMYRDERGGLSWWGACKTCGALFKNDTQAAACPWPPINV